MNYPFKVGQVVKIISKSQTPGTWYSFADVIEKNYYGPELLGRIKRFHENGSLVVCNIDEDLLSVNSPTGNFFLPQDLLPYFQAGDMVKILAKSTGRSFEQLARDINVHEVHTFEHFSNTGNILYAGLGGRSWEFLPTDLEWIAKEMAQIPTLTAKELKLRFKQQLQLLI
jgi:hypothetical protein